MALRELWLLLRDSANAWIDDRASSMGAALLRDTLSVQRRGTTSFRQRDGRTLNVRKSTVAEPELLTIYQALSINAEPGGTKKLIG